MVVPRRRTRRTRRRVKRGGAAGVSRPRPGSRSRSRSTSRSKSPSKSSSKSNPSGNCGEVNGEAVEKFLADATPDTVVDWYRGTNPAQRLVLQKIKSDILNGVAKIESLNEPSKMSGQLGGSMAGAAAVVVIVIAALCFGCATGGRGDTSTTSFGTGGRHTAADVEARREEQARQARGRHFRENMGQIRQEQEDRTLFAEAATATELGALTGDAREVRISELLARRAGPAGRRGLTPAQNAWLDGIEDSRIGAALGELVGEERVRVRSVLQGHRDNDQDQFPAQIAWLDAIAAAEDTDLEGDGPDEPTAAAQAAAYAAGPGP